jgi:hypothetical protein
MTIRSCFASLSGLALFALACDALAEPPLPASVPPPAPMAPIPVFPRAVPYHEGDLVPYGYHVESRVRKGLLWSGVPVFGVFYSLMLFDGLGRPGGQWLLVPVAGPAIYVSHQQSAPNDDMGTGILVVMATGGQAVGAALVAAAFLAQKEWLVMDSPPTVGSRMPTLTVVPQVDRASASVVAVGTF